MNSAWRNRLDLALAVAASAGVLLLMWLPVVDPFPEIVLWYEDKWQHLLIYAVLTFLWIRAGLSPPVAALSVACWSAFLEAGQLLVPYRSFDLLDLLANGLGCLLVVLLLRGRRDRAIPA